MKKQHKITRIKITGWVVCVWVVFFMGVAGCSYQDKRLDEKQPCIVPVEMDRLPSELMMEDFVLVMPQAHDNFETLAERFLDDKDKGWLIARFNRQEQVMPGNPLIVPLKTVHLGGLKDDSYQVVPVLVYHQFSNDNSDKMTIKTEAFYEQMLYLTENGYSSIKLNQLLDFMEFKAPLPEKSVVITIDDGWLSTYDIAYPILKKFEFSATLFVYTDFIGGEKAMNWSQILEMYENGFDIQSHTMSHQSLTILNENEPFKNYFEFLIREIEGSKKVIEDYLGSDCRYLAYPFGETNDFVVSLVKKLGFRAAFTVSRGSVPFFANRFSIRRSVIYGDADMNEFVKNISFRENITLK